MGLLAIATLPARAAIAGAELVIATGRLAAQDGPLRRPGGYEERISVLLAPEGAIEQLGRLGDPAGPLARIEQLAVLTAEDRPLGRSLAPRRPAWTSCWPRAGCSSACSPPAVPWTGSWPRDRRSPAASGRSPWSGWSPTAACSTTC